MDSLLRNYTDKVEIKSSWTALTMHKRMKKAFETKYITNKYFRTFLMRFKILRNTALYIKELIKLDFSATPMLV